MGKSKNRLIEKMRNQKLEITSQKLKNRKNERRVGNLRSRKMKKLRNQKIEESKN